MDLATILNEVATWPVERVGESLAETPGAVVLTEAHEQDLRRRLDADRDNPEAGSPWEEVEARLRRDGCGTPRRDSWGG